MAAKKWECYRCSYVVEADAPPEECPSCHYSLAFWLDHEEVRSPMVKDYVRTVVLKLDAGHSALEAAQLMKKNDASSVLVTRGGEVAGIVTERDILTKVAAEDLPSSKVILGKIMTYPLITVTSDTSINDAIRLMSKHHVRRLVVTENGRPIGMLGQRSILGGSFRLAESPEEREKPE